MLRSLAGAAIILTVMALSLVPSDLLGGQALPLPHLATIPMDPGRFSVLTLPGNDDQKQADDAGADADKANEKEEELTLERLFPEKSFFGPSAYHIQFSHDGRYAAYLYRPYIEQRHGNDLWMYDSQTGETRRLTMVSVMSVYQDSARKVKEDRIEKAKKRKGKDKGEEEDESKDDESEAAGADRVSGDWEGTLTGMEGSGLPPEGVTIHLALMLHEDGVVTGMVKTSWNKSVITHGTFVEATGVMECELSVIDSELHATMRIEVAHDDTMKGIVKLEGVNLELQLTAKRTAKLEGRKGDAGGQEKKVKKDDERGGDAQTEETVEEGEGDSDKVKVEDTVDNTDADDEKAPRYHGISTYTWAPHSNELIFTSDSDLYRFNIDTGDIERLTRTRAGERDVQYLPDGSGYTYLNDDALIRVEFGNSLLEQIDPDLPEGESMSGYHISPDGTRLVFLANKGESYWGKGQLVNIVNYRSRFAQVNQVTRHMSDDPLPEFITSVYLYDLNGHMTEEGNLKKVYEHRQSGPRDIMRVPEWALDSSRVAWAVFDQSSSQVDIMESEFKLKEKPQDKEKAESGNEQKSKHHRLAIGKTKDADEPDEAEKKPEYDITDAKVIYRLLHNGGPNTPGMIEPQYLPDSRRLVFITELSGFRHLHVLDPTYEQLDQLTKGRFEVYPFHITEDHTAIYATATKEDPTQIDIYRIDVETGEMRRLSPEDGSYGSAAVNDQGACCLANFTDFGKPTELVAIDIPEHAQKNLTDSHPEEAHKLTEPVPEYFTYRNRHGQEIHGHMFKPDDWTQDDKRPLLMYVYGGPLGTTKMATRGSFSGSSYFFPYYMARKHGYVTCTIDPRGASGYGGLFEKSNYEQVGRPQVEDLVDGAKWFAQNMGVDEKRIGLHGWSFGGFQTQMCLYTEPDVFACGMAGAGPTEWENYNSWYSTGTIGPSRTGHTDLAQFSLLPLAKNLKAKLLLMHGMEDSNVLYQDTVRVYRELLKAGKETLVELFLDPTGGHGMGGDIKTLNRYRKYEEFLLRTIGEGTSVKMDEEEDEQEKHEE